MFGWQTSGGVQPRVFFQCSSTSVVFCWEKKNMIRYVLVFLPEFVVLSPIYYIYTKNFDSCATACIRVACLRHGR
jgi:hypothetical protein